MRFGDIPSQSINVILMRRMHLGKPFHREFGLVDKLTLLFR